MKKGLFLWIVLDMILIIFINSLTLVGALGVSSSYGPGRPFEIYAGETKTIFLFLQNQEDFDMRARASVIEGFDIASLVGETEYLIPAKTKGIEVSLKIKIPRNAKVGDKYLIKIGFRQVSVEEEGMVQLAVETGSSFDVLVIEELEVEKDVMKKNIIWIILGILIIIILVVVIRFIFKRKQAFSKPVSEF